MSAPMVNATIIRKPNVSTPRMPLRARGLSSACCSGGGAGFAAGTGCDCHQLQYGQTRANSSMPRPQLMQLLRLAIARQFLQPPYLVVPGPDALIRNRKSLQGNVFGDDFARVLRETVQRGAARVVCVPIVASNDDAVDTGGELRCAAPVETEPDEAAQETADERLRRRLRPFGDPHFLHGRVGDGERRRAERGAAGGDVEVDRHGADVVAV